MVRPKGIIRWRRVRCWEGNFSSHSPSGCDLLYMSNSVHASPTREHDNDDEYQRTFKRAAALLWERKRLTWRWSISLSTALRRQAEPSENGLPHETSSLSYTQNVKDFGLTPEGWSLFRDKLVETIPALNELEPRYDQKGQLDGYINGAGFLSHHVSEMTLRTVEALIEQDVPAYSSTTVWLLKSVML